MNLSLLPLLPFPLFLSSFPPPFFLNVDYLQQNNYQRESHEGFTALRGFPRHPLQTKTTFLLIKKNVNDTIIPSVHQRVSCNAPPYWGFHGRPVGGQGDSERPPLSQKMNFCLQTLASLFTFLKLKYLPRYNKGKKCVFTIYEGGSQNTRIYL